MMKIVVIKVYSDENYKDKAVSSKPIKELKVPSSLSSWTEIKEN